MRKPVLILSFTFFRACASACPICNKAIADGIYDSQFYPNLITMLSAFLVLAVVVGLLTAASAKRHRTRTAAIGNRSVLSPVPLTTASLVLGIGIGGFIDGILLHQILQMHEMLSNKIPATNYIGKSVNMFWDGIFHLFCLIVVLIGISLLWKLLFRKDADHSGRLLAGGLLAGFGIFNVVEGTIDHQILKLHNVVEFANDHRPANFIFLGISAVILVAGYWLIATENKHRYSTRNDA